MSRLYAHVRTPAPVPEVTALRRSTPVPTADHTLRNLSCNPQPGGSITRPARLLLAILVALLLLSCAPRGATGLRKFGKETLRLHSPFDLAVCWPVEIGDQYKVGSSALAHAIIDAARPALLECFANAGWRSRGISAGLKIAVSIDAQANIRTALEGGAADRPELGACLQQIVQGLVFPPAPAGAPIEVSYVFSYEDLSDAEVVFGYSEGMDIFGSIRLKHPAFCSCFEPFRDVAPPALLRSTFKMVKGQVTPQDVEVAGGPDAVNQCLGAAITKLEIADYQRTINVKYPTRLINSRLAIDLSKHGPEVRWRHARSVMRRTLADYNAAVAADNTAVEAFNRALTAGAGTQTACSAMLDSGETLVSKATFGHASAKRLSAASQGLTAQHFNNVAEIQRDDAESVTSWAKTVARTQARLSETRSRCAE